MTVDDLINWAEEETHSPYLWSPPLKERPLRKDFDGKALFHRMWRNDDHCGYEYSFLTEDEVGDNVNDNKVVDDRGVDDIAMDNLLADMDTDQVTPTRGVQTFPLETVVNMVKDEVVPDRDEETVPQMGADTLMTLFWQGK